MRHRFTIHIRAPGVNKQLSALGSTITTKVGRACLPQVGARLLSASGGLCRYGPEG